MGENVIGRYMKGNPINCPIETVDPSVEELLGGNERHSQSHEESHTCSLILHLYFGWLTVSNRKKKISMRQIATCVELMVACSKPM